MAYRDRTGELLGEYRLLRFLGKGGLAEVYLGEHRRLQTTAAIKLLLAQVSAEEQQQFLEEARKVAHLDHPHIVRVLDYSVQQDTPFLVMQYAAGGSLRQRHPGNIPLPIETILPYVQQVAEALQFAHDQRVIHRDVKPENMLLDARGKVLLADFGIALALQHTRTHQTVRGFSGTPLYAAPEQLQAKPGLASDQYALATALYRWLTGRFPFETPDFISLSLQKLQNDPPPLRTFVPHLSPAVEQVVLRALARNSAARYPSVRAFADAIVHAAGSSDALVYVPSPQPAPPPILAPPLGTMMLTYRGHPAMVGNVVWSPDSQHIASADGRCIRVWQAVTGNDLRSFGGSEDEQKWKVRLSGLAWSSDGAYLAAGRLQYLNTHNAQWIQSAIPTVWEATTGQVAYRFSMEEDMQEEDEGQLIELELVWSRNSRRLAFVSYLGQTLYVWEVARKGALSKFGWLDDRAMSQLDWSSNDRYIATGAVDGKVGIWDVATEKLVHAYQGQRKRVEALAWSPDDRFIATAHVDHRRVFLYDVRKTEQVLIDADHQGGIRALAWEPTGKYLASGGMDHTVQICDTATGQRSYTYTGHLESVFALAWSPDGRCIASGSTDGTVQVWSAG